MWANCLNKKDISFSYLLVRVFLFIKKLKEEKTFPVWPCVTQERRYIGRKMEIRGFSHYTKDSYYRKAKEIVEYFGRPISQVTTKELVIITGIMQYMIK